MLSLAAVGEGQDEVVLAGTDDGVFLWAMHCGYWRRLPTRVEGADPHPRVVHVAAASPSLLAAATPQGLLVSRDGGESWERRALGLAREISAVAFSDREPHLLAAATPLGLFRSDDQGLSFVQVSNGVAGASIRSLAFLPGDPRVLFATTPVGLLRSADTGQTWARYGGGLPLSDITGLAFGPDGVVFASDFQRGGVYPERRPRTFVDGARRRGLGRRARVSARRGPGTDPRGNRGRRPAGLLRACPPRERPAGGSR